MSDEPKKSDAFRPQDPFIPGVTDNPKRAKEAEKLAKRAARATRSSTPPVFASPALWAAILGVIAVIGGAYFGVKWWENQRALHQAKSTRGWALPTYRLPSRRQLQTCRSVRGL